MIKDIEDRTKWAKLGWCVLVNRGTAYSFAVHSKMVIGG